MDLSDIVKTQREKRDFSQRQLAYLSGISNTEISRIESGERKNPSPDTLKAIAPHLDISYEELMKAAGYLSFSETPGSYKVNSDESSNNEILPTPKEEHLSFYRKVGQLSDESIAFLDKQADRLLELEKQVIDDINADRKNK